MSNTEHVSKMKIDEQYNDIMIPIYQAKVRELYKLFPNEKSVLDNLYHLRSKCAVDNIKITINDILDNMDNSYYLHISLLFCISNMRDNFSYEEFIFDDNLSRTTINQIVNFLVFDNPSTRS